MADDDHEELTVRLPRALMRRVRETAADIRLAELAADGLAMLLDSVTEPEPAPAASVEPESPGTRTEPAARSADGATAGPLLPVLAVGDAALVLEGLAGLRTRLDAAEERERVTQVWIKTTLAELFAHTTPFPTGSDERRRREEAAARLALVDRRVRNHVRAGRDANGTAGETPATS